MNNDNIIQLAADRIIGGGTPGTVKHSGNQYDDRLEFSAEVDGKKVVLFFTQHCHTLLNKAEGATTPIIYNATCTVDGVQAFANADASLTVIQNIFKNVKSVMAVDKAHYYSREQAFDFLVVPKEV